MIFFLSPLHCNFTDVSSESRSQLLYSMFGSVSFVSFVILLGNLLRKCYRKFMYAYNIFINLVILFQCSVNKCMNTVVSMIFYKHLGQLGRDEVVMVDSYQPYSFRTTQLPVHNG